MYNSPLAKRYERFKEEWRQALGRRDTTQEVDRDIDTRRQAIIGEIVIECFPQFLKFEPKPTEVENEIEFAPVKEIMTILSDCGVVVDGL